MTPPATPPWRAYVLLAASMALVGSYVGLSKLLLASFPVFVLAWLRYAIGGVAMLPWLRRAPGEARLTRADLRLLFWEAFFGNFLFTALMLYGVAATSAVAAGVVMAALPAAVGLLSALLLRERLAPAVRVGIVLAVAGIGWLALARSTDAGNPAPWWGYALLVGAVLCEALYVVIGKRLTAGLSPKRIAALINLWGLALVTPLALWQVWALGWPTPGLGTVLLLVYYALAASMWSVWLWMSGLTRVPANQAGVFTVLLPVTAALVGVVWLGEPFGAAQAGSFALALAGLLVATWPSGRYPTRL
ncbi:MAG: DMT family transporter [Proteobacteria bacterium]|nr:DMT family transporter [Pseudomonadota bacterium]